MGRCCYSPAACLYTVVTIWSLYANFSHNCTFRASNLPRRILTGIGRLYNIYAGEPLRVQKFAHKTPRLSCVCQMYLMFYYAVHICKCRVSAFSKTPWRWTVQIILPTMSMVHSSLFRYDLLINALSVSQLLRLDIFAHCRYTNNQTS